MNDLTIGEVARLSDLRVSAIRYYDSLGLLPATRRVSGHRRFSPEVTERLTFIKTLQQVGFGLLEIAALNQAFETNNSPVALCQKLARQKLSEVDKMITRLKSVRRTLAASLNCTCLDLRECTETLTS